MSRYNLPTGVIVTAYGAYPVYADDFLYQPTYPRWYAAKTPAFSGNAHQRRVKLRAWLRGDT